MIITDGSTAILLAIGIPAFVTLVIAALSSRPNLRDAASVVAAIATFLVVLDLLGNLVNLFDTMKQFDDVLHFVNWTFLVAALVLFMAPAGLARWNLVLMGSGFGAIAIIAWEGVEWIIQEMGTTGLQLTYDDTIGDLVLSTAGGVLGALVTASLLARNAAPSPDSNPDSAGR